MLESFMRKAELGVHARGEKENSFRGMALEVLNLGVGPSGTLL